MFSKYSIQKAIRQESYYRGSISKSPVIHERFRMLFRSYAEISFFYPTFYRAPDFSNCIKVIIKINITVMARNNVLIDDIAQKRRVNINNPRTKKEATLGYFFVRYVNSWNAKKQILSVNLSTNLQRAHSKKLT